MTPHGEKEPMENLKDKFRSIFSPKDPQKKKNALPPKAHFSIWYFLMAFLLFSYLQQYFFSKNELAAKCIPEMGYLSKIID